MATGPGDRARTRLLELERRRQLAVVAEFEKIKRRLAGDISDILERIEKQRRIDGNASPGLLIQKARLNQLLDQVTAEIRETSRRLAALTASAQNQAIDVAAAEAKAFPQLQSDLNFFDADATRSLVGLAGNGQPLQVHFAKLAAPARQAMFDALFYGIAAGTPNQAIAKEIRDAIGGTTAAAMTTVRTETNRAYREASRQFYADTPAVKGWRWLAALDLNTCPICWGLHGRIFKTKTKFGTHPNCRCSMVPVFEGDDPVPTGPELFAKLTPAQQKAILGPGRLALYQEGARLSDFIETNKSAFGIGRRLKPIARTKFRRRGPVTPEPASPAPAIARATPKPASAAATIKSGDVFNEMLRPGDPVPIFPDVATAAEYMERRFPGTKFGFTSMDVKLVQAQAAELAKLFDEYPAIQKTTEYVGDYLDRKKPTWDRSRIGGSTTAYAIYNRSTKTAAIRYHKEKFTDLADVVAKRKRSFGVGHHVTDNIAGTTSHEFGHLVDYHLEHTETLTSFVDLQFGADDGLIKNIKRAMYRQLKPRYGELSDYGMTNVAETWAEGFAMIRHRPEKDWPAYVRAQKKLIDLFFSRKRFGPSQRRSGGTAAEREAALAEIKKIYDELGLKL